MCSLVLGLLFSWITFVLQTDQATLRRSFPFEGTCVDDLVRIAQTALLDLVGEYYNTINSMVQWKPVGEQDDTRRRCYRVFMLDGTVGLRYNGMILGYASLVRNHGQTSRSWVRMLYCITRPDITNTHVRSNSVYYVLNSKGRQRNCRLGTSDKERLGVRETTSCHETRCRDYINITDYLGI